MSNQNWIFKNLDDGLPKLARSLLAHGDEVGSRAGRTMEFSHVGITLTRPWQREITHPTRKANLAAQIAETMWVLAGRSDIGFLSHYLPRAADFSDDGVVWRGGYGPRIRHWMAGDLGIDQLQHVVTLLRESALTRRAVISIYDPARDSSEGKDIPCNDFLIFTNRNGKLDLAVTVRSNDLMWGWSGINVFEWSALLEVVANLVGVGIGSLHFNTASLHLYDRHWRRASDIAGNGAAMADAATLDSPQFNLGAHKDDTAHQRVQQLDKLIAEWFRVEERIRTGLWDLRDIEQFPEPMMQSWLRVIAWWWTKNPAHLQPLNGTRLAAAARVALQPKHDTPQTPPLTPPSSPASADTLSGYSPERFCAECGALDDNHQPGGSRYGSCSFKPWVATPFLRDLRELHKAKHGAYGDSWKRRGEVFAIIPNIARKVDRLAAGGETDDETIADTAADLLVYLAKYRTWLDDLVTSNKSSDTPHAANKLMGHVERIVHARGNDNSLLRTEELEKRIVMGFDTLEDVVLNSPDDRVELVDSLLEDAYLLAYRRAMAGRHAERNATRAWNPEAGQ